MKKAFLKSTGAVLTGIVVIFATTHLTDLALEKTGVMKLPFDSNPLWLKLAVTLYRNIYVVLGSYVTARLAPSRPMKHSIILGCIGLVLASLGAIAMWQEPPHWYPIALIVLGFPGAWLGGKMYKVKKA